MPTVAAWILLLLYPAFSFAAWRSHLREWNQQLRGGLVFVLLVLYLLAAGGQTSLLAFLAVLFYVALPVLLLRWNEQRDQRSKWVYLLVAFCTWIPLEPALFLGIADLLVGKPWGTIAPGLSVLPNLEASLLGLLAWVPAPVALLIGLNLTLFLFLVEHPLPKLGFTFALTRDDLKQAISGFLGIGILLIPVGFQLGFLSYAPQRITFPVVLELTVLGYFLVALVEEILFRGIIQNILGELTHQKTVSLLLAAVIFGLSHLNNATPGFAEPNWGYALMATLAGVAYGWVWQRTGKVTASALTHMMVNLSWGLFWR